MMPTRLSEYPLFTLGWYDQHVPDTPQHTKMILFRNMIEFLVRGIISMNSV
jgi:hypothetical protein